MRNPKLFVVVAFALTVGACSGADDATSATSSTGEVNAFPVVVSAGNGDVTIESRPSRIVSTSSTVTEMLFAIGAGPEVVAVDKFSTYPLEAPTTDLDEFSPNVEAIVDFAPDLVMVSTDLDGIVEGLNLVAVPVLLMLPAATLDDVYTQIEQLGIATGHRGEAGQLVAQLQAEVADIVASVPEVAEPLSYYHELDSTYYTATEATFIGEVYTLLGLVNIADGGDAGEFPQLSAEYILDRDPDLIFLANATCCGESLETVAARPGFGTLTAVRKGAVIELDSDIVSRWGPRIIEFMRVVGDAIADLERSGT